MVKMQLEELIGGLEEEETLIIKDYVSQSKKKDAVKLLQEIRNLYRNGPIESKVIAELLGYENFENYEEIAVYPKGYRILNKIPKMPSNIVDSLVKSFKSFQHILLADIGKLDSVEGMGEIRARTIKQSLKKMQEQFVFDNILD